jgi:hypothetical protein
MRELSGPPIRTFLVTPFLVIGHISAWICSLVLPEPVHFINLNDVIEFDSQEELDDYYDSLDNEDEDDDFYK